MAHDTRALGRGVYMSTSRGTGDRLYGCFNVTSSQVIPVRPGTKTPRRWDSTHLPTQGQHPLCRLQPRTAVCVSRAPHWLVPAFLRGYESARQKSLTTQSLMQWVSMGRQNEATRSLAAMLAPSSRGPRFEGARPRVPAIPACVWPLWQPEEHSLLWHHQSFRHCAVHRAGVRVTVLVRPAERGALTTLSYV